ncbi:MAG: WYL domain-containing protein [Candidatus Nanopelagicales bacterium]
MRPRGRPADAQHRRMRGLLSTLAAVGEYGVTRKTLMEAMGLRADDDNAQRVFFRDVANLRASGWQIRSIKRGLEDRYTLKVIDHRMQAEFTPDERRELLRAARSAGIGQVYDDLDPDQVDGTPVPDDPDLRLAHAAIATRCLVTFVYSGSQRRVHPYDLARRPAGWLLRGREEDSGTVKNYYLDRAVDLDIDRPGTAEPVPESLPALTLDPMRRREHPPVHVVVECRPESAGDIITLLGANGSEQVPGGFGMVRFEVVVTYMDAFLNRLFELGERASLVGPPEARAAARTRLQQILGASA